MIKKRIKRCIGSKRAIITFIVLFFLTNMVFALSVLEEIEAKKREEMKKNKITYVPTTSTPELDRELAKEKMKTKRDYEIKSGTYDSYIVDPKTQKEYFRTKEDLGFAATDESLIPLTKNKILYMSVNDICDSASVKYSKKAVKYPSELAIINKTGDVIKKIPRGGYFSNPFVSSDRSFFIIAENQWSYPLWEMPEDPLNPSYFSTKSGIIAFDGNGNKLWEDEFPKGTSIDYNYFDISKSGKYTFITLDSKDGTKRYIYKHNGEKIMNNSLYDGWFSRNEDYFIFYDTQHPAFLYEPITRNKTYVGINFATSHEYIDISGKEAGIAVSINEGTLIITDIKKNMRIAKIKYNSNYYKLWNKAGREATPDPPDDHDKGVYISKDGTEILIKTTRNEYRFKREEQ